MNAMLSSNYKSAKGDLVKITILLLTISLVLGANLRSQTRSIFGYSIHRIASESMSPKYKINDLVLIKRVDFDSLRVNDVVLYSSVALNGRLVLHRISRLSEGGFYCKGDNNRQEDNQLIDELAYFGKAVASLHIINDIIKILKNPLMLMPFVLAIAFIVTKSFLEQ